MHLCTVLDRRDAATWTDDRWPMAAGQSGILPHHGAGHSAADARAKHVKFADVAVQVGTGSAATTSYLDADAVLAAARATGADCIHPVPIPASFLWRGRGDGVMVA